MTINHAIDTDHTPRPGITGMWEFVATALTWLDAANPRTDHEIAMRIMKIGEENGEVVEAYIGMIGQNPRKGVHATLDDLTGELCDVAVTALVALATVTGDASTAEKTVDEYLTARSPRLLTLLNSAHQQEA